MEPCSHRITSLTPKWCPVPFLNGVRYLFCLFGTFFALHFTCQVCLGFCALGAQKPSVKSLLTTERPPHLGRSAELTTKPSPTPRRRRGTRGEGELSWRGRTVRGQRTEGGGQRSEVSGQRTDVRGQRTEVGDQRSEVSGQWSVVRAHTLREHSLAILLGKGGVVGGAAAFADGAGAELAVLELDLEIGRAHV